ncbi:MAG: hypothetical protein AAFX87_17385 [Bacteroidota bacterium]
MRLTEEQENVVRQRVESQGMRIETLHEDVIDHLCCVIESQLNKGKPFEALLDEAIQDLAPNGLMEIERTTIFLLNAKRIIIMKKLMYTFGFLGAVTLTAGVTFKLLHIPFGGELFIIGFLTLLLLFVPLLAFDRYKVAISKAISERLKIILGAMAAIITGMSGVFKLMHLQGVEMLLLLGAFVFAFGFLPFLFFNMYKRSVS